MSNKNALQLADEWIVGFLDRQKGLGLTIGEACRIAFQAGYRTRVNETFEETAIAYRQGQWIESNSPKNSDSSDDSDGPDLQEQLESLQQYMTVAQRKIMVLQANVEFLLYLNREEMGESEAIRRMQQTIQGFGRNHE